MSSSTLSTALTTVATALFQAAIDAAITVATNTYVIWGFIIVGVIAAVWRLFKRFTGKGRPK